MVQKRNKLYTGVGLEPDVVDYLDLLCQQTDRSRTWLVNKIIRQHANTTQILNQTTPPNSLGEFAINI